MKNLLLSGLVALGAAVTPALVRSPEPDAATPAVALPEAGTYTIDTGHSTALFKARHLGISNFYGVFNSFSGEVKWDRDRPEDSYVLVKIDAGSIDSRDKDRDGHLISPDFLNAKEFPEIVFESTAVRAGETGRLIVTGDLTVRGVTKPVDVNVEMTGAGDKGERFGYRAGFEGRFTISGKDFEMAYTSKMPDDAVSHDIDIIIALETQRAE